MQCPNCKQDYGEMITICPVCFIEITQSAQASTIRERRSKRKREDTSSKSKGLLESTLASWFGKSDTESPASVKTERKKRQDFSKSSSGDYSSFDISSGVMETPSVSSFSEGISSVQSISSGPISILTTDSQYTDKAESNESLETVIKSSYTPSAPPPKYETPEPSYSQTPSPSRDQLAQEHYRKGSEYEKQGRLKEALMEYGQAIAFNPKWSEPYFKCAMILIKNKDYNNALQRLLEVIKLNPNHADAYYQLGKIYMEQNLKEDAERYLKMALKSNPNMAAAKNMLEKFYQKVSAVMQKPCNRCGSLQNSKAKFCGNCGYTFKD